MYQTNYPNLKARMETVPNLVSNWKRINRNYYPTRWYENDEIEGNIQLDDKEFVMLINFLAKLPIGRGVLTRDSLSEFIKYSESKEAEHIRMSPNPDTDIPRRMRSLMRVITIEELFEYIVECWIRYENHPNVKLETAPAMVD